MSRGSDAEASTLCDTFSAVAVRDGCELFTPSAFVSLPAIFPVLLELVSRPPGRVSVEDWRYEVTRLLAMCAGRGRGGYVAALGAYVGDGQMASVAEEVEDWLAEEA